MKSQAVPYCHLMEHSERRLDAYEEVSKIIRVYLDLELTDSSHNEHFEISRDSVGMAWMV